MTAAEPVSYGPYSLFVNLGEGRSMLIQRLDPDDRKRTVAFVNSLGEWERFVAALKAGENEVAAVRAIDAS